MIPNRFEPNYNYYKTKDQIVVNIEVPGNCKIESNVELNGEYIVIKITGIKEKDEIIGNITNDLYNRREYGKFSLDIPLKQEDFYIKNEKPKIDKKDGIFKLVYYIEEKQLTGIYPPINK